MHFKSRRKKRLLKCISLQAPLMAITAPIEKTLSTAVLSMKKEDDKSTATTALIFNKNIQSKCLDEHSTAPRINMIQAFQKLKESFPKNKCFITELIMLERYRNMGDLVIKNIDHE
ncbi:uncharacterized protein LOC113549996 [Rhopalosiphum maidis]|uniref:uncharacterized protein LOC113549990 n=1 Tax=Rhopalosiphum maidis TaxID=43146 RepID=UPI000F007C04|nr:uncharacterized protein LOC113549990 [Rhopalosiphum maidis]XP_026807366.1 uncharacterized protein LOC113549996 [Rhopalosiphum maidis]